MNKIMIKLFSIAVILIIFSPNNFSTTLNLGIENKTVEDSVNIIEQYSLFSEYYKNKDYESALPYGWTVLKLEPKKFSKWIYFKMEDLLWNLHDSSSISLDEKKSIEDTIMYVYDMAFKYYPDSKSFFMPRRAYVAESWLKLPPKEVERYYLEAIKSDPKISTYWINRLGQYYKSHANSSNNFKTKAIDLYTNLAEKEPNNSMWNSQLESMVENIDELVKLSKKTWLMDKNNLGKAWKFVTIAERANNYVEAIFGLKFLVQKAPKTINYWTQLTKAYQKTKQFNSAIEAYKKLVQLEPNRKENYLNIGIIYMKEKRFSQARKYFQIASDKGGKWGLPIYYIGQLYENSAQRSKFDFQAKLVYLLAIQTYRRAYRYDHDLEQARGRARALSSSVPTKEDYFFRGYKKGQKLKITGRFYNWIGRSVTIQ